MGTGKASEKDAENPTQECQTKQRVNTSPTPIKGVQEDKLPV
jgi:hypothetical protein